MCKVSKNFLFVRQTKQKINATFKTVMGKKKKNKQITYPFMEKIQPLGGGLVMGHDVYDWFSGFNCGNL